MIERQMTAEQRLILATEIVATGVVIEDLLLGPDPTRDLITFVAVANVMGIPATPMLMATKEKINELLGHK